MFITSNSRGLRDNKSRCSLFPAWRGPRPPDPQTPRPQDATPSSEWAGQKSSTLNATARKKSVCLSYLSLPPSPFDTITVAFTKGPHPLAGCYSIFKHHSAESQPPRRPALRTCNKLSSSETTETSGAEAGQGHFNESHLINIFILDVT